MGILYLNLIFYALCRRNENYTSKNCVHEDAMAPSLGLQAILPVQRLTDTKATSSILGLTSIEATLLHSNWDTDLFNDEHLNHAFFTNIDKH